MIGILLSQGYFTSHLALGFVGVLISVDIGPYCSIIFFLSDFENDKGEKINN